MKLFLENGTVFGGDAFGYRGDATGEVVFSTGMTGYVESLTDPSYSGQILVCTYPLIGNYGVPSFAAPSHKATDGHGKASEGRPLPAPFESAKIQIAGLVVTEYSEHYSHKEARMSLATWLKQWKVPALSGVDTRAITKMLRERGSMLGVLGEKEREFIDPNREHLVARVSPKEIRSYGSGRIKLVAVDCGMKENIIRCLVRTQTEVTRVPWDFDFNALDYDALIVGNGPGDPQMCQATVRHIRRAMQKGKPILGVCLGNQLLALAAGASTYKLKYGHRGQNQPCIERDSGRCYITSQNHGYSIDASTLSDAWTVWFENANDGSVEGIRHTTKPWASVQFHPEAAPGPTDTAWIFDEFIEYVARTAKRRIKATQV